MVVFSECPRPIVSDLKQSEFVSDTYKLLSSQVRFLACLCAKCLEKKNLCFRIVINGTI